ncbi:MAG TPA: hypothetical protein PLX97_16900, partial [Gemmatales bacterium]|nr:hypothetical protein [Gemmatales bacterium]
MILMEPWKSNEASLELELLQCLAYPVKGIGDVTYVSVGIELVELLAQDCNDKLNRIFAFTVVGKEAFCHRASHK